MNPFLRPGLPSMSSSQDIARPGGGRLRVCYNSLLLFFFGGYFATAQPVGANQACSCAPGVYHLQLDLNRQPPCPGAGLNDSPGILGTSCFVNAPINNEDQVPVIVDKIEVLEMNVAGHVVVQEHLSGGPFFHGDVVTYTTRTITNPQAIQSVDDLTNHLQIQVTGRNQNGTSMVGVVALLFSTDCSSEDDESFYPFLQGNGKEEIGWLRFQSLGPPPDFVCPLATSTTSPLLDDNSPTHAPLSMSLDYRQLLQWDGEELERLEEVEFGERTILGRSLAV